MRMAIAGESDEFNEANRRALDAAERYRVERGGPVGRDPGVSEAQWVSPEVRREYGQKGISWGAGAPMRLAEPGELMEPSVASPRYFAKHPGGERLTENLTGRIRSGGRTIEAQERAYAARQGREFGAEDEQRRHLMRLAEISGARMPVVGDNFAAVPEAGGGFDVREREQQRFLVTPPGDVFDTREGREAYQAPRQTAAGPKGIADLDDDTLVQRYSKLGPQPMSEFDKYFANKREKELGRSGRNDSPPDDNAQMRGLYEAEMRRRGLLPREEQGGGEQGPPAFNSAEEALAAGLPPGTVVMIGGRRARIER